MSLINNPYSDGQVMSEGSLFRPIAFYAGGSYINNSTTETALYEINIPANRVSTGVFILASCEFLQSKENDRSYTTFRLKMGSPTATELKSLTIAASCPDTAAATDDIRVGQSLVYWENNQDWTNSCSLIITAQNGTANTDIRSTLNGITVFGI